MAKIERCLLCTCEGSMQVDADTAAQALGGAQVTLANRLCTGDIDIAAAALDQDGTTLVACGQMAGVFQDLAEDLGVPHRLATTDIRDRAGWSSGGTAFPKQAALLAEAKLPIPETPTKDVASEGTCLILGNSEVALGAAAALSETLAVTCLLSDQPDDVAPSGDFDIALGGLSSASGALGGFEITVDAYRQLRPGGRGAGAFDDPISGAKSDCDIILDLRGRSSLFPAPDKREGYVRADPGDPLAVERAIARAASLQGVFEKPLYIRFDETLCAHSRAGQTGCDRCLNACPAGAILPDGDTVAINPDICAGCGACAAVCPSGAASYDDPPVGTLFARLRTLASEFRKAGGEAPRALFHDAWGRALIDLSARFGAGLPPDVIPVATTSVEGIGHAELLAALGTGFAEAVVLLGPKDDRTATFSELELAQAILGGDDRLSMIDPADPDALTTMLDARTPPAPDVEPILPQGGRREVTRNAATALTSASAPIPLPSGAPYGAVVIDPEACTLCLACVSLCPSGALGDNPDKPQVRFQETACLQCGLCAGTCPENAITLTPQLDLAKEALTYRVLNEEDPFECIECGTPFGSKSTILKVVEKLEDKHWMFQGSDNVKLIQMCDNCRVNAQYHQENSPFKSADRPVPRTTDDYLKDRKPN